jgi:hypothetical protein
VPEPEPEPELEPEPAPLPARAETLDELMARLERGLSGRQGAAARPPSSPVQAGPQVFPEAADDRLQSAIDSLQRLALRHP